jgi:hypothetical protein
MERALMSSLHATSAPGKLLLRRTRRYGWLALLATTVLLVHGAARTGDALATSPALLPLLVAVVLLGALATYRSTAAYLRGEAGRDTDLALLARRDGVALAVNTVQHHIGNKLAVTVGHSEMLADDPRLPPDAREQANKALSSAMAAADVIHRLAHQLVRVELDDTVAGPAVLDLNASTTPPTHHAPEAMQATSSGGGSV